MIRKVTTPYALVRALIVWLTQSTVMADTPGPPSWLAWSAMWMCEHAEKSIFTSMSAIGLLPTSRIVIVNSPAGSAWVRAPLQPTSGMQ